MLLVSAGLLLKDFARLRSMDIGVRREGVWTAARPAARSRLQNRSVSDTISRKRCWNRRGASRGRMPRR